MAPLSRQPDWRMQARPCSPRRPDRAGRTAPRRLDMAKSKVGCWGPPPTDAAPLGALSPLKVAGVSGRRDVHGRRDTGPGAQVAPRNPSWRWPSA
jgi:hypothetical protein